MHLRALGIAATIASSSAGRLKRGMTTRLRVIGAETWGITYQSVMPISWFIRAAARGSSGCSRGPGDDGIDVAHDGLRLVQHPAVVLEGRDAAERVAREMQLLLQPSQRQRGKFVFRPLLFQGQQGGAHIRTAGNAVNDHP